MSFSDAGFHMMGVNLVRDCEVKTFDGGNSVLSFTVARNRDVKKGEEWVQEVDFFDCKYWCKSTKIADILKKGQTVYLSGDPRQDRWEKDGQTHSRVIFNVYKLVLPPAGKKDDDNF